ncbi:MAG TPA: Re/Si-specific NAD(P)(+) transhydrogenase subunit alpha [Vicinamibacteria bacterium]|nr:Re/Si-specific NAD(P)(+) transhydrogenase subunit alpha [Vicinamibacteria bacterium]
MIAAVLKETWPGERRVAVVPAVLASLAKAGVEVVLEAGAGLRAGYPDEEYEERGAKVRPSADEVVALAELVLTVRSLAGGGEESGIDRLRRGQVVAGFLEPLRLPEGARALAERGVTAFALELVPRITRAQTMDALSSTATVVGYKAVLLAADRLPRMFPMLMTAAGTVTPARVLVIGAGVAGLQAIATARRLGAAVEAYDLRPAVKEQVRSLGARFVELPLEAEDAEDEGGYARAMDEDFYRRQGELLAARVAEQDVVITAAAVPGRKAPVLVTEEMVRSMRPGSVIVDVAGEQGGNCAASDPGATVERHGVTVMAPLNLAATVPFHASQLYARNLASFVANLVKEGRVELDLGDEILRESLVARDGEIVSARVREALGRARPPA